MMKFNNKPVVICCLSIIIITGLYCNAPLKKPGQPGNGDPLPSWNEGTSKKAILDFVNNATHEGNTGFIPVEDRIACFDNDGTLWTEQPVYTQLLFAIDRIKALAPQHPEWKTKEPYKSILAGDIAGALQSGEKGLVEMVMTTHVGMSSDEFTTIVKDWIKTAQHPRFHKPYTACVYQPMLELLAYLRANQFKTFIVSGGGIEFMRPWTQETYGIPSEQVVGSGIKTKFEERNGQPILLRTAAVNFVDDKQGKPVGILEHIGKRPVAAFGNSDGDFQMLQWTTSGNGLRFGLIVHHDDGEREYAYDRGSPIGTLERGLDEAPQRGWIVVSMKNDWKKIFPDSTAH
ncbi:MAG: HAD family hydrolase [Chitinophagaceae bacterium]